MISVVFVIHIPQTRTMTPVITETVASEFTNGYPFVILITVPRLSSI